MLGLFVAAVPFFVNESESGWMNRGVVGWFHGVGFHGWVEAVICFAMEWSE